MNCRLLVVPGAFLLVALLVVPAHGWQAPAQVHAEHHLDAQAAPQPAAPTATPGGKSPTAAAMMASSAKLDELVKKMNDTQGQAKIDAMAELLTALVQTHQSMRDNMSHMMEHSKATHGK